MLSPSEYSRFITSGELRLPADYSPENAMKSAWLMLQETVDRDKKPALQVCTRESVYNALLGMAVQGLKPRQKAMLSSFTEGLCLTYFGSI